MDIQRLRANVKTLRDARGWEQQDLAREARVSKAYISRLEAGKTGKPRYEELGRVAAALGTTTEGLLAPLGTVVPSAEEDTQRLIREIATDVFKTELEQYLESSSNKNLSFLQPLSNKSDDASATMGELNHNGSWLPDGHERAEVYGLRASADVGRYLLHDDAGETPIEVVMFESRRRRHRTSRVIGLQVQGDCLAPRIPDGATVLVEVERPGFPATDLGRLVNRIVFARVGDAMHIKGLRRRGGGYVLAPLNGDEAIPVTDEVCIVGVVIETRYEPLLERE